MTNLVRGKKVLVTGAAGSVGSALLRRIASLEPAALIGFDNSEAGLFRVEQEAKGHVIPVLGDIRDQDRMIHSFKDVDLVFHAAALKHVPMCERSPFEAVKTNLLGVQNVITAGLSQEVSRVIFTSTDKAVNPTNVMGASKLMGEQLVRAANISAPGQIFSTTRFGNVLGSSESVIPIFARQIAQGGPVTLTSPEMTRFIMTMSDAIDLLLGAASLAEGGEIFVTKMKSINITTLARVMIDQLAPQYGQESTEIELGEIGPRPGEKMFEELMTEEESRRTVELVDYFVVSPALADLYRTSSAIYPDIINSEITQAYTSRNQAPLSEEELKEYFDEKEVLQPWEQN